MNETQLQWGFEQTLSLTYDFNSHLYSGTRPIMGNISEDY